MILKKYKNRENYVNPEINSKKNLLKMKSTMIIDTGTSFMSNKTFPTMTLTLNLKMQQLNLPSQIIQIEKIEKFINPYSKMRRNYSLQNHLGNFVIPKKNVNEKWK